MLDIEQVFSVSLNTQYSFHYWKQLCVLPQKEPLCELKWPMALLAWDILCYKLDLRYIYFYLFGTLLFKHFLPLSEEGEI